ncbi:MAG: N-acetylmuramoyl-L-alanine amidase, partial [Elusimicrobia bacterium]|nr:N-acetylmuramoyl-L-alanine amidase [Elusimicrobiota bacterium]
LTSLEGSPGLYRGSYQIQPGDKANEAGIKFILEHKQLGKAKAEAKGTLTILSEPFRTVEVSTDLAQGETGPGNSFFIFVPKGTRFLLSGREGKRFRIALSETETAWFDGGAFQIMPDGFPHPQAVLSHITTISSGTSTLINLGLSSQIPYLVEPTSEGLQLKLFYTRGHIGSIVYDTHDSFIQNIQWKQLSRQTCLVSIQTNPKDTLWGYHLSSSKPGTLTLELRRAPRLAPVPKSVFKGLTIVLDPGHSTRTAPPWDGAIGPLGTQEPTINLLLAQILKTFLEKEGANVLLTRSGEEEIPLYDRPRIAWENRGDIFLSLHNNALPDGVNPFEKPRGFSIFYYHLHSLPLAQAIHRAYFKNIRLPDEGVRYGSLAVARMSQMPAVLLESAYLIFPDQEELLLNSWFRRKLAATILEGTKNFLEKERIKQIRNAGNSTSQ